MTCTLSSTSANPDGWLFREPMLRKLTIAGGRLEPLGATSRKPPDSVDVIAPEVTETSAGPAVGRAPVTAVIDVLPDTTMLVAGTPPMLTVASLAKPVPVIVIGFPPVVLPLAGEIADTRGVPGVGPGGVL